MILTGAPVVLKISFVGDELKGFLRLLRTYSSV